MPTSSQIRGQEQDGGRSLRVLALASKPAGLAPSQRFRIEQWAPRLERDHGIQLELAPFESPAFARILGQPGRHVSKAVHTVTGFVRRGLRLASAGAYDAIVIHREAALIGPAIYERLIAWSGKPIIFDFDDAIWMHQPGSSLFSRLHFLGKTRTICRLASAVTPGNQYLAAFASRFNSNVSVVPTTIELETYPVVPEPPQDPRFIVGWTGSTSTLRHFEGAREALEQLANRIPLTVKVICNEPPARPIEGADMQFVRWTAEREAIDVGSCHVSIMPLPDDEFARGKCGLKALQSMATGRPVVLSPVGMNTDLIRSGENGFLAATPQEFVDAMMMLANSPELRSRVGQAGRKTVEENYSAEVGAAKFARVIRSVVG